MRNQGRRTCQSKCQNTFQTLGKVWINTSKHKRLIEWLRLLQKLRLQQAKASYQQSQKTQAYNQAQAYNQQSQAPLPASPSILPAGSSSGSIPATLGLSSADSSSSSISAGGDDR